MNKRIDTSIFRGLEFDWLGVDGAGHVALFSSGGGGLIPELPSADVEAHDAAMAAILAEPPSTTAVTYPSIPPKCINTWRLMAERGLYAYDSSPNADPYSREAVPQVPRLADTFPNEVRRTFVRLPDVVRFDSLKRIDDELLVPPRSQLARTT